MNSHQSEKVTCPKLQAERGSHPSLWGCVLLDKIPGKLSLAHLWDKASGNSDVISVLDFDPLPLKQWYRTTLGSWGVLVVLSPCCITASCLGSKGSPLWVPQSIQGWGGRLPLAGAKSTSWTPPWHKIISPFNRESRPQASSNLHIELEFNYMALFPLYFFLMVISYLW